MGLQASNNKNIYIYVFDNTLIKNGNIPAINDDNGRTKQLREILTGILDIYNNTVEINVKPQVYGTEFQSCDNPLDHKPECMSCDKVGFHALQSPFILFIHTTNSCSSRFINQLMGKSNHAGCWIACYSGGNQPAWYENLETNSFKNIRFFGYIGDDVKSKWDIPAFVKAVLDKKENAFDYLVRKPKSHLIALSILCQGYLAAHGGKVDNHAYLDGWDKLPSKLKEAAESKKTITEKPNWWASILGKESRCDEIKKELAIINQDDLWVTNLSKAANNGSITLPIVQEVFKECQLALKL